MRHNPLSILLCIGIMSLWSCAADRLDPLEVDVPSQQPVGQSTETIPFFRKDGLRILDIGNSYTDDATALLPLLVKEAKVNLKGMSLYKAVRGGASFKSWCDVYNDQDGSVYKVSRVVGDSDTKVPVGSGAKNDGNLFRRLVTEVKWDLIFIHQYSGYAPYYDEWKTEGSGGHLEELLTILKKHQPDAKIGFLLIHSYSSDFSGNKEKSSFERWKLISESVRKLCDEYGIEYVIPYGTAVQNLRSSSLNDEYDLTRDGTHCGEGLCRYAAACCYYESIIAPRTGISVLGNPARYAASSNPSFKSSIDVTDKNAGIAQRAAVLASKDWYKCSDPEGE